MSGKRDAYFTSIANKRQLKTLRWSIVYGGFHPCITEDDEGRTGMQIAAANNHILALDTMLEHLKRMRELSVINDKLDEDGRTPLMLAAAKGHIACVKLLLDHDAKVDLKDEKGKTARDLALAGKHHKVVKMLDGEESEEEDVARKPVDTDKIKGTNIGGTTNAELRAKGLLPSREKKSKGATFDTTREGSAPEPVWEELKGAIESERRELLIVRPDAEESLNLSVDPALWWCGATNLLQLQLPTGVLTQLPEAGLRFMPGLLSLDLSGNALTSLPADIGSLGSLKTLRVAGNNLTALPREFKYLENLETVDLSGNALTSSGCKPMHHLKNLVTVLLDENELTDISTVLSLKDCTRLTRLSIVGNAIAQLPDTVGLLKQLQSLSASRNQLTDVPAELGELKKLQQLSLSENPIADPKLAKNLAKAEEGGRELSNTLKLLSKMSVGSKGKKKN